MKPKNNSGSRNAVLYARVSTRDQEEFGHSLPAQIDKLRQYAANKGLKIIKEFSFQETGGQKKQRKKFEEMIMFLRQHKADVMPVLLCMNVDRVTRNFKDAVVIDDMRLHQGLEVHFVQDGFSINPTSSGSDMFMWEGKVFLGKQYLNRIRDDAVRSREYKIKNGEWSHRAPIGYLNKRDEHGRNTVVLDADRAPLLRRVFVEYAKGGLSVAGLGKMANQWGLRNSTPAQTKISNSQIHYILRNPFYFGMMGEKDELIPHKYTPLIDKATWDKCQQVRDGWHKKPFAYSAKPFAFRGLITCAHCGSMYTSEQKKGKYTYLFCTKNKDKNCPAPRVKEEAIFAEVETMLERISIPDDVLQAVKGHLAASHDSKNEYHNAAVRTLRQQEQQITKSIQKVWDLYLKADSSPSSSITTDELDKKLSELKQEQANIRLELANHEQADNSFYIGLNLLLELVKDAAKLFKKAKTEQKRKLLNFLYWNLQLEQGKLVFSLRKPFDVFLEEPKDKVWLGC